MSRLGMNLFGTGVLALVIAYLLFLVVYNGIMPFYLYNERFYDKWEAQCVQAAQDYQDYVLGKGMTLRQALQDDSWIRANPTFIVMRQECDPNTLEGKELVDWVEREETSRSERLLALPDGQLHFNVFINGLWYETLFREAALVAALLGFCCIFIPYIAYLLRRILQLSRQTQYLTQGNLEHEIVVSGKDELAQLGRDMERMRRSILQQIHREKQAVQTNQQLITSLSHDLRTPLTKLMGYLEILRYQKFEDPQQHDEFLQKAAEKAHQLKEMSDEIFLRFQVEANNLPASRAELVEGSQLLGQVLSELCYDLQLEGFSVEPPTFQNSFYLYLSTSDILRIFDNLFSNLKKYADPAKPITITQTRVGRTLCLEVCNAVAPAPRHRDSYGVGIPTMRTLMEENGGTLETQLEDGQFCCRITFPLQGGNG